jgi:molybdate transport system regulatory protein
MTTTWTLCGAGRGVGKTHLAQRLCDVLPESVYAKRGCGKPRADGPQNFFQTQSELASFVERCRDRYDHIVVECNAWARKGRGDIIVFVDAISRRTDVRGDAEALRSRAHLRVGPGASVRSWKRVLRGKLPESALREAVCDVLAEQKRYLSDPGPAVRTKVWFVFDEEHTFGAGLARLLENVDRFGTLREAAEEAHISYRHAWDLIKTAERHVGHPLLVAQPGGKGGGRSRVSEKGRHLLEAYNRVNAKVAAFADKCAAEPFGKGSTAR